MKALLFFFASTCSSLVHAQDVLIIGEVHDNPAHHRMQADLIAKLQPAAIVFEMITARQADQITDENRQSAEDLEEALDWSGSGWPDFAMYYPIFAADATTRIYGALVPGPGARHLRDSAVEQQIEELSLRYDLNRPLPPAEQQAREALQMAAHCDALPEEALPSMVKVQRLRDAALADAARQALADTGGPVAVITGNGHARPDWGVPALLAAQDPGLDVRVIGQTEDDHTLGGGFETVLSAPAIARTDPCAVFR